MPDIEKGIRVLVCGGRDFHDQEYGFFALDQIARIVAIIHGASTGADAIAELWAASCSIPTEKFKADWDLFGNAAGPIRNLKMLKKGKPDMVVAFPGGHGTANMVKIARDAGVLVLEVPHRAKPQTT